MDMVWKSQLDPGNCEILEVQINTKWDTTAQAAGETPMVAPHWLPTSVQENENTDVDAA